MYKHSYLTCVYEKVLFNKKIYKVLKKYDPSKYIHV